MEIFILEYFYERGERRVIRIFSDAQTALEALKFGCDIEPVRSGTIKKYRLDNENEYMERCTYYKVLFGKITECK